MLIGPDQISQKFSEVLASFQGMRLATNADAPRLAEFVNRTAMSTGRLKVGFNRGNDYFSLLRLQGEKYSVLICEENGQVVALGAVTFRKALVRGVQRWVGYFQDLRVSDSAQHRSRVQFYKCFSEFVRLCPTFSEFDHCSVFLTAILDENAAALAALSRPSFTLEYTRLMSYTAHAWPKIPAHFVQFGKKKNISSSEANELVEFYSQRRVGCAFDLTPSDIERLLTHAHPVVIRSQGEIEAACLLVQTHSERCLMLSYDGLGYSWKGAGLYISALRSSGRRAVRDERNLKNRLIRKALWVSSQLPGAFVGFVNENQPSAQLSADLNGTSVHTHGALYRVYHPDHTQLTDFSHGFLRPIHSVALEWVFM
jgi:hypothetical protein